jgi:methyltransferase (TIGR00027 family)
MQPGEPSRTALGAARHRAAHQLLEQGRIFSDPLAIPILGENPQSIVDAAQQNDASRRMRIFIAVRTRFTEDTLAAAVVRGVTQLVVLGAGLDTYAYRGAYPETLRIFEVDHPATQAWKRRRLIEAAIPIPASLTYAPIDFECETLATGLDAVGFNPARPTFFSWLGVVPYLTPDAFWSTLRFIASLPNGAHVVFDYSDPPGSFSPEMRAVYDKRAARVAAIGEPWVNHLEAETLHPLLKDAGFSAIEDLGPRQIAARYFPDHAASRPAKGGHILHAVTQRAVLT